MNEKEKVEKYFQETAKSFDVIYAEEKPLRLKIIDFLFRKSMLRRFELALKECKNIQGKHVLDIGCGSGRYSVELAKQGAKSVLGIDFSRAMLAIAERYAKENRVSPICSFIFADFLKYNFKENFDVSLAIGVFEYFKNPKPFLEKSRVLTKDKIIFSLPNVYTFRSCIRKIRLGILGYGVYFYTKRKIEKLLISCNFKSYKIINLGRDFFVVAYI